MWWAYTQGGLYSGGGLIVGGLRKSLGDPCKFTVSYQHFAKFINISHKHCTKLIKIFKKTLHINYIQQTV